MFTGEERLRYVYAFVKYNGADIAMDFWQDAFVRSAAKFTCVLKSRQVGFSFAAALKGLVKAMDPARAGYTKQFISYNESDALEKIRYAQMFYDSIPPRNRKRIVTRNKGCLEFEDAGGKTLSRLISFPCKAPRGKNGDICLDEYAIYLPKASDVIYTAAMPLISRGGCFEVGSTPLGKVGKFHEICSDKKSYGGYVRFTVPWWMIRSLCSDVDAAAREAAGMETGERVARFGSDAVRDIYGNMSQDDFRQEYECEFIDSKESYIPLDLIYRNTPGRMEFGSDGGDADGFGREIHVFRSVDEALAGYAPEINGSPIYMGYDVARERDAISFVGVGLVDGGRRRMAFRIEERGKDFDWQKDTARRLLRGLPVFRCCMDATGMGSPICEELRKEFGERVEGFVFDLAGKEALAMGVKSALERRGLELENDRDFHRQIHGIKRLPAVGRHFRYDSARSGGVHADSFWALALACHALDAGAREGYWDRRARDSRGKPPKPRDVGDVLRALNGRRADMEVEKWQD